MTIRPDQYYPPSASEMRVVGAEQTLARWRCEGFGPAYIKIGGRILYLGGDVLTWLEAHRVQTGAA